MEHRFEQPQYYSDRALKSPGLRCLGCPRRFLSRDWPFVWETTERSARSSSALFQLLKHPGGCLDFLVLLSSPQWKLNSVGYLQNLTLSSHNHTSFQPLCRTITLDLTNDHFRFFLDWYRVSICCSKKIKTPLLWIVFLIYLLKCRYEG